MHANWPAVLSRQVSIAVNQAFLPGAVDIDRKAEKAELNKYSHVSLWQAPAYRMLIAAARGPDATSSMLIKKCPLQRSGQALVLML